MAELDACLKKIERLEAIARHRAILEEELIHLASLPEQNPDLVIETSLDGTITYLNPVAYARFPELPMSGFSHPIFAGVSDIIASFRSGQQQSFAREIQFGQAVFEQKVCFNKETRYEGIRLFMHDITARVQAENAIQELAKQVINAQEEERRRVSRELHDETGQALTALKISLQLLLNDMPEQPPDLRQNLQDAIALVETTRSHIRRVAQNLRPPSLDTLGLNLTLEDYCRQFGKHTRLDIQYRGTTQDDLPDPMAICLYRFLQEALTNVANHAYARRIQVTLDRLPDEICLEIMDDGRGFDLARTLTQVGPARGIGLQGMQERIELLGGRLEITSRVGEGTRLIAHLPVGG